MSNLYRVARHANPAAPGGIDVTLCVSINKAVCQILKWDHGVFIKLQEVSMASPIKMLDCINMTKIFVAHEFHFSLIDLETSTLDILNNPVGAERTGPAVRAASFGERQYLLCYQNVGIVLEHSGPAASGSPASTQSPITMRRRPFPWRQPVQFADRLGPDHFAACGAGLLDVYNVHTGKIAHIFETKRDRLRSLSLLTSRDTGLPGSGVLGGKVYLLSFEEKEGGGGGEPGAGGSVAGSYSVLCISNEVVPA
ncbi:Mitogen-activated protein kinase kinase kinase kinase 1 [Blastocladiella emersonii ATCC 22665]|nr:Mitogen-activated protein kinase kinase kinase kinase 1 [Blastocladiella emersonii ATCC 22665]